MSPISSRNTGFPHLRGRARRCRVSGLCRPPVRPRTVPRLSGFSAWPYIHPRKFPSPGSSALPIHGQAAFSRSDSPSSRMAGILLFLKASFLSPHAGNTSFRPSAETLSGTGFLLPHGLRVIFQGKDRFLTSRAILLVDGSAKEARVTLFPASSDSDAFQLTAFEMSSSFFRPLLLSLFRTESLMTSSSISHSLDRSSV